MNHKYPAFPSVQIGLGISVKPCASLSIRRNLDRFRLAVSSCQIPIDAVHILVNIWSGEVVLTCNKERFDREELTVIDRGAWESGKSV